MYAYRACEELFAKDGNPEAERQEKTKKKAPPKKKPVLFFFPFFPHFFFLCLSFCTLLNFCFGARYDTQCDGDSSRSGEALALLFLGAVDTVVFYFVVSLEWYFVKVVSISLFCKYEK